MTDRGQGRSQGRQQSESTTDESQQKSREVAQQGQQKAAEAAQQGREKAESQIDVQKERVADELEGVTRALRQTGEQLREENQGSFGGYADQAAEQTDRLSRFLHEKRGDQLLGEVEDFARNRPAVFLGGAFAVGIAAARFIKSSAGEREYFDVQSRAQELGAAAAKGDANAAGNDSASSGSTSSGSASSSSGGSQTGTEAPEYGNQDRENQSRGDRGRGPTRSRGQEGRGQGGRG